ncbi:MAG TPA: hypothetical protein DEP36_12960 [Gammaproteobacteria bacterium]|mgnify:FL=1|nr:hypothetical protein [Gammaproteobacteria bacterium]HRF44827.1 helix-turn-helix domain-containing protein [Candidatus Competibacteraceae bacterium]
MTVKATSSIQVITRLTLILDAMAAHDEPVSLKTLSKATGLHPSTTFRILASLTEHGFVERSTTSRYRLGIRLLQLGNRVHGQMIDQHSGIHSFSAALDELNEANG